MKTLHLNLKRKWFDMILSGEKKEEYRGFTEYWIKRLTEDNSYCAMGSGASTQFVINEKHFDTITFSNGYSEDRDQFIIECLGIDISEGNPEWGAEQQEKYFVLKLGEIIKCNIENKVLD